MAKKQKNPNGDGSLYQLKDGRWQAAIVVGHSVDTGRPIRRTATRRTRSDALAALRDLKDGHAEGQIPTSAKLTLAKYLELWINDSVVPNLAPPTAGAYGRAVRNHVLPYLGEYKLKDIGPLHIKKWLSDLDRNEIGGAARQYAFRTLRTALNEAVQLQELKSNPCSLVKPPRHTKQKIFPFTAEEAKLILSETETHPLHAAYVLALSCGPRYGEIFGLALPDIDFTARVIHIRQQLRCLNGRPPELVAPKTKASIRTIELTDRAVDALKDRRKMMLVEGRIGSKVFFCGHQGGIMWPQVFYKSYWKPLLQRLELKYRGFHHTRHTFASLALSAGTPIPVVSQVLGHTNPAMTLSIYSHVMPTDQKIVTANMTKLFG